MIQSSQNLFDDSTFDAMFLRPVYQKHEFPLLSENKDIIVNADNLSAYS
jgi:hypothetical protein